MHTRGNLGCASPQGSGTVVPGEAAGIPGGMTAVVRRWGGGRLEEALQRQIDHVARQPDVSAVAVMPDVHAGRAVPNGIAVATRRLLYPDLVGADIGCGIACIRFRAAAAELGTDTLRSVLARLSTNVPTLKHAPARARANRSTVEGFGPLSCERLTRAAGRDGAYQLGTLGRGNHFLELARDDEGAAWAVVHTGSRPMGQAISAHHLAACRGGDPGKGADGAACVLPHLDLDTPEGRACLADMQWAFRYAAANRAAILNAVADLLEDACGIDVDTESFVESPHNTATCERHAGEMFVVHRKSANDAALGRRGVVAGSMAVGSRITVGLGNAAALASSAHGAGRVMSRAEAFQRIAARDLDARMGGVVYHEAWARRLRDEAPQAYRDLHEVMHAQRDLVRTAAVLVPLLNDKRP